ncbi:BAB2_0123 family type IV secretion system effector [Bartonella schoenbuchensis]|uniref:BAB2_0123 family type IV secretion system effector n=1 Tax=Bartonella schoenbuchensis TaxID=165694 RepID=UPI0031455972
MSWFIVNIASALLALISLGVFIITTRKLTTTIHMGRELAKQVQTGTSCLDRAISILREEHQEFRDENRKMDARIIESTRIRRNIDRSVAHMENVRNQLQSDLDHFRATLTTKAHGPTMESSTQRTHQQPPIVPKNLPVFVQRKMH